MNNTAPMIRVSPLMLAVISFSLAGNASAQSQADQAFPRSNFYVGGGIGKSAFHVDSAAGLTPSNDKNDSYDTGWKSYVGYQFDPTWGIEAGYASLGKLSKEFTAGRYQAKGDTLFIAGTATVLHYGDFALKGRLLVTSNHLKADQSNPNVAGFSRLTGSRTGNVTIGLGGEYKINKQWTATLDMDDFGSYSKQINGGLATVGMEYHF